MTVDDQNPNMKRARASVPSLIVMKERSLFIWSSYDPGVRYNQAGGFSIGSVSTMAV